MPMLKRAILIAGAALLWSGSAYAIDVKARIEAPGLPDEVWAVAGDFCAIKDWHPAVKECTEETKDGAQIRTLTLGDGGKIVEKMTEKTDRGYSYDILESPLPVQNYHAKLWVELDDEPDRTVIYWTAKFDAKDASDAEAEKVITGILKSGVDGIKDAAIEAHDKREGVDYTPPVIHGKD